MLSQAMAQRIEHRKLADLTPYHNNSHTHPDEQIAAIAGSIAQFGFNAPILIDSKGNIIAGHGRYLASLKVGLDSNPSAPARLSNRQTQTRKTNAYFLSERRRL